MEDRVVVSLCNVTKKYKKCAAIDNMNLRIERGKIYGLVGKNGAGKTTMMRLISGLSVPTKGEIKINTKRMRTLIEAPGLNMSMTAKENLKFYRLLYQTGEESLSDDELLEMVGLENVDKKTKDFSLGMKQRLGIAVALVGNPDFVMLDEPVNGLDPVGVVEIRNLIKKLNQENQITFLVSSHNLPELYQTATDFIIIDKGRIKKEVTQDELEEHEQSLEEYFLNIIR